MSKRTGYGRLMDRLNVLDGKQRRLARAILKIESTSRIGDGIHAAAAIILDEELEYEGGNLLWEMVARAGFAVPPDRATKLKRFAAARSRLVAREAYRPE